MKQLCRAHARRCGVLADGQKLSGRSGQCRNGFTSQLPTGATLFPVAGFPGVLTLCTSLLLCCLLAAAEKLPPVHSVPDLRAVMYRQVDGFPCVRLNTVNGPTGCGNPGSGVVSAPLQLLSSPNAQHVLKAPRVLLVPLPDLPELLQRTSSDSAFRSLVVGVLVEGHDAQGQPIHIPAFSPAAQSPQSQFVPEPQKSYPWNPAGTNISSAMFNFPVLLLSNTTTQMLRQRAEYNAARSFAYPLYVVEMNMVMQTTASGTPTSGSCLERKTCLPLGGFSVLSAIPNVNTSAPLPPKPTFLAVASLDAAAFFRDAAVGADSSLSGAIALLAAVDAVVSTLVSVQHTEHKSQLLFAFLTGESWGYLGSRTLVADLASHAAAQSEDAVRTLDQMQVLELGSVGNALTKTSAPGTVHAQLFGHTSGSESSEGEDALGSALRWAADSLKEQLSLKPASKENPGLPPSSLLALSLEVPRLSGIVLEEFDGHFKNAFYGSSLDNMDNVNVESICITSTLVARALLSLLGVPEGTIKQAEANVSLVQDLVICLLSTDAGLACPLAAGLITPSSPAPNHYAGVMSVGMSAPSDMPPAWAVSDTSRFVWNFVGARSAALWDATNSGGRERRKWRHREHQRGTWASKMESSNGSSSGDDSGLNSVKEEECSVSCKTPGTICVGSRATQKGRCLHSSTRYIASTSPRVHYNGTGWHIHRPRPGNSMDSADPIWTESFWQTLTATVYLQDSAFVDHVVLACGWAMLVLSVLGVSIGGRWVNVHLKQS